MKKVELKNGEIIEGFDNIIDLTGYHSNYKNNLNFEISFCGRTIDVPEELAKSLVHTRPLLYDGILMTDNRGNKVYFKNYKTGDFTKRSGIRSILSACDEPYCIICKKAENEKI